MWVNYKGRGVMRRGKIETRRRKDCPEIRPLCLFPLLLLLFYSSPQSAYPPNPRTNGPRVGQQPGRGIGQIR